MEQCRSPLAADEITPDCERVHENLKVTKEEQLLPLDTFQLQEQDLQPATVSPLEGVFCACAPPS